MTQALRKCLAVGQRDDRYSAHHLSGMLARQALDTDCNTWPGTDLEGNREASFLLSCEHHPAKPTFAQQPALLEIIYAPFRLIEVIQAISVSPTGAQSRCSSHADNNVSRTRSGLHF